MSCFFSVFSPYISLFIAWFVQFCLSNHAEFAVVYLCPTSFFSTFLLQNISSSFVVDLPPNSSLTQGSCHVWECGSSYSCPWYFPCGRSPLRSSTRHRRLLHPEQFFVSGCHSNEFLLTLSKIGDTMTMRCLAASRAKKVTEDPVVAFSANWVQGSFSRVQTA